MCTVQFQWLHGGMRGEREFVCGINLLRPEEMAASGSAIVTIGLARLSVVSEEKLVQSSEDSPALSRVPFYCMHPMAAQELSAMVFLRH